MSSPQTGNASSSRGLGRGLRNQLDHGAQLASLVSGSIIVVFAIVYCLGCAYFHNRFWPNTYIGDADVSSMTIASAIELVDMASQERSVTISGQGVSFTLTGAAAGLVVNSQEAVDAALSTVSPWQWVVQIFLNHDDSFAITSSFDLDLLRQVVEENISEYNSLADDPIDASLYFDETTGLFEINPGYVGTKYDVDSVMQTIMNALTSRSKFATLTSVDLVPQAVTADDEYLVYAREAANALLDCNLDLTINGTYVASVNASVIQDWIVFDRDTGDVYVSDTALAEWVDGVESLVDSYGTTRSYTRPDGKYVTVSGGNYGWISNGAALESLVASALNSHTYGSTEIPLKKSASTFNPGGADWAGSRYIDVDITEQHVRYYDEYGNLLWESDCVTGAVGDHDTPTGVYTIYAKQTDQTLLGLVVPETGEPEYESFVNYWIPFNDGVGLHDATWQSAFGGTRYKSGYGSHGCINLPLSAAASLFSLCSVGDVVVVHY